MTSPDRVAVLGCGLIGTSIAMAAIRSDASVRGYDSDARTLARAAEHAGFETAESVANAVEGARFAFVCTPIATIPAVASEALAADRGVVVSDAGSVKSHVVSKVTDPRFVGGHPMAGSERSGPEGASASLLEGAVWVLTPVAGTDAAAADHLEEWIARAGARPVRMEPERHDRVVAVVSHLPQVLSTALMALAAREEAGEPETLLLAAGGFRDLTRLAASNAHLWADILTSNSEELAGAIDMYVDDLVRLRNLLKADDQADVERALEEAKKARLMLTAKPQVRAGVAILQIPVPDRPGVLADLTAALGEREVNIEDLQIVHSPEGGRGSVHITVAAAQVDRAAAAIAEHGFEAVRIA